MYSIHGSRILEGDVTIGEVVEHIPSPQAVLQANGACRIPGDVIRLSPSVFAMKDADGDLHFWETKK